MNQSNDAEQQESDISTWDLPHVEDASPVDLNKTNAFNRRSDWKYEPPEEVEEMLPPTAEEIEAIRAAAYQDGFSQGKQDGQEQGHKEGVEQGLQEGHKEGMEKGHAEGLALGEEEINLKIEVFKDLIYQLNNPVAQVQEILQKELIQLSVSLARAVIKTETVTNPDIIFQALSEGLKVLPIQESTYQIHLHPDDIALIKEHFGEDEITKHNWLFIDAPQMTRGGCDISTTSNAVDVSVERRTRDVLDQFLLEQGIKHVD